VFEVEERERELSFLSPQQFLIFLKMYFKLDRSMHWSFCCKTSCILYAHMIYVKKEDILDFKSFRIVEFRIQGPKLYFQRKTENLVRESRRDRSSMKRHKRQHSRVIIRDRCYFRIITVFCIERHCTPPEKNFYTFHHWSWYGENLTGVRFDIRTVHLSNTSLENKRSH
jgi:hypothetical protein